MAGRARRAREHSQKMREKRARKDAKRAHYASLAGSSRKHKKQVAHSGWSASRHRHLMENCGNPACRKCGVFASRNASGNLKSA